MACAFFGADSHPGRHCKRRRSLLATPVDDAPPPPPRTTSAASLELLGAKEQKNRGAPYFLAGGGGAIAAFLSRAVRPKMMTVCAAGEIEGDGVDWKWMLGKTVFTYTIHTQLFLLVAEL